ncbi:hypothetical protein [Paraferrimonas sp. SM1919]|uniref:hypothetical protein n=1 Tax=Paraferrimonas sp. SM1919 TaxID=2662263 RepID=UPI0013D09631|nr:hypothetical protein [Paraferrimonas sp. SM1919]
MKKVSILLLLSIVVGVSYHHFFNQKNELAVTIEPTVELSEVTDQQKLPVLASQQSQIPQTIETATKANKVASSDQQQNELENNTSELLENKPNFLRSTSASLLNNSFLLEDSSVSQASVIDYFSYSDFGYLIEEISQLDVDELSLSRESSLLTKISSMKQTNIIDQQHACRGKLCFIELKASSYSDEEIQSISQFGSNYAFTNVVQNESDETIVRAMYIETENPSLLRVTR